MPTGIDHLVIAVPDPDAAAAELERELGIAFPSGGRHPGAGTFNRIAFLGMPYLELIGIADPDAARRSPIGTAALRALEASPAGGFATFALLDDDLDATVARLRADASRIREPVHGSRVTADGETVEWWTATHERLGPEEPPFLIRHARTGFEWSAEAIRRRWSQVQPAGCVVVLAMLELSVRDPNAVAQRYRSELGLRPAPINGHRLETVGPHTIMLKPRSDEEPLATVALGCQGQTARTVDRFGIRFEMVAAATS
jgi:catechol 2,3-dioxygenase-like lactoylglutathione lyase family enzyme